jgi:hypothetical protein
MSELNNVLIVADEMANLIQCDCYVDKNGDLRNQSDDRFPNNLGKCYPCQVLERWGIVRHYLEVSTPQES